MSYQVFSIIIGISIFCVVTVVNHEDEIVLHLLFNKIFCSFFPFIFFCIKIIFTTALHGCVSLQFQQMHSLEWNISSYFLD